MRRRDGPRRRRRRPRSQLSSATSRSPSAARRHSMRPRSSRPTARRCWRSAASTSSSRMPESPRARRSRRRALELWDRNNDILARGYFLVAREAARRAASRRARAAASSSSARRTPLLPGRTRPPTRPPRPHRSISRAASPRSSGRHGIRVNTVNPDAVLEGSKIWDSAWREERARAYGIPEDELEEHYRARTTLKVNVLPADIAEAVLYFASPTTSRRRAPATSSTSTAASRWPTRAERACASDSSSPVSATRCFPEAPQGRRPGARAARPRGRVPGRPDVLRPASREQWVPRRGGRARARFERDLRGVRRVVSPSSSCVGMVREFRPALASTASSSSRSSSSRDLGVEDVGASFPHRVTYHPTCHSLRVTKRRRRAASPAARGSTASSSSSCPRRAECCGFGGTFAVKNRGHVFGDARRQVRRRRRDGRRGVHRGRQLVPDADRRWARAAQCGRPDDASRGDPRRRDGVSRSGTDRTRRPSTTRRTCATRRRRFATSEPVSSPKCRTGRSCARPGARSRQT